MSELNDKEEFVNKVRDKLISNLGFSDTRKNRDTIESIYIPLYCYLNSIYPDFVRVSALKDLPIKNLKEKDFNTFHFANFLCGLGMAERRKQGNTIYICSKPLESVKTEINQSEISNKEIKEQPKPERRKVQEI